MNMSRVAVPFLLFFAVGDAFSQVTPPPATFSLTAQAGSALGGPASTFAPTYISSTPGTLSSNGLNAFGNGTTTLTLSDFPNPSILITGTEGGPSGVIRTLASMAYYLYVFGPTANQPVPISVTGQIVTNVTAFNTGGNDLTAGASFEVGSRELGFAECNHISGCGVVPIATQIDVLSAVEAGSIFNPEPTGIFLGASLAGVTQPDGATGRSFIDPIFTIDPTFAAANPGYSLELSAGIGNMIAPVPEPGTYPLMLAGFALLAFMARRKKNE